MEQDLVSLTYVSRSRIGENSHNAIAAITATSVDDNGATDVTGVLLFSGCHFLQVLEGPKYNIVRMISRIAVDERHANLMVVQERPILYRRYPAWPMWYAGERLFLHSFMSRLHAGFASEADLHIIDQVVRQSIVQSSKTKARS